MLSPCEDGWRQWHLGSDLWVSPSLWFTYFAPRFMLWQDIWTYLDNVHVKAHSCDFAWLDGWDIDICFQQGIYTISTTTVEDYAWSILWGSLCALRTQTVKGCCQCYHFSTIKNSATIMSSKHRSSRPLAERQQEKEEQHVITAAEGP